MMHKMPPHWNGTDTISSKFCKMLLLFIVVFSSTQCDSLFTCAGHGNDGPIEGLWKCVEHGVGLVLLKRVAQARED